MRKLNDESGQALIIAALCMTCLIGFVALAADVGLMFRDKRIAQTAADSAAIAGAAELKYGGTVAAAQAAAAQNGITDGSKGATVAVHVGPLSGPHAGNKNYVEVIASQNQPTFFMRLFNRNSMTVAARAVATNGSTKGCIYTLGTTGPDLSLTGNSSISITTCGIVVNSNSSDSIKLVGNAALNAQSIGTVGGVAKTGSVTLTPTPVTGIVATSDPLAYLPQPPAPTSCSANPNLHGATSLAPGCYTGLTFGANSNVTLSNSGTYVVNGPLNIGANATVSGTGVTFDLLGSTSMSGNATLNLTAPSSGILFYQPLSNTNPLALTGNSGATLEGIIYAPGAAVSLTGNSGSTIYLDFVVKTLSLVGNASIQDYDSINSNSVLTSPRLVE